MARELPQRGFDLRIEARRAARWAQGGHTEQAHGAGQSHAARELAQVHTEKAIATLVAIMGDRRAPAAARSHAARTILEYGHGKPVATLEHSGADGGPLRIALGERLERALARVGAPQALATDETIQRPTPDRLL